MKIDTFYSPDGRELKVNSVFQIWERRSEERTNIKTGQHAAVQFVPPRNREEADFAIRNSGNKNVGKVYELDEISDDLRPASFFYLKKYPGLKALLKKADWSHIHGTAGGGLRFLNQGDIIAYVKKHMPG